MVQGRVFHPQPPHVFNIQPFGEDRTFHELVYLTLVLISFLDKMQCERT